MKKLSTLLTIVLIIYFFLSFEFRDACIAALVTGVLLYLVNHRIDFYFLMKDYADRYNHIYIVPDLPAKIKAIIEAEDFEELIVFVDPEQVLSEVKRQEKLLVQAKNNFFCDRNLNENQRIEVKGLMFRDADHVNESKKQLAKRLCKLIKADRKVRHPLMNKENPDWYNRISNRQNL